MSKQNRTQKTETRTQDIPADLQSKSECGGAETAEQEQTAAEQKQVDDKIDGKVDDKVDGKVDDKVEEKVKYAFPTKSRCPRCGATDTIATSSPEGKFQYRRCRRAICRWKYTVMGTKI